ncbi:hypothetical protein K2173_023729 [Erythroxylum novogranatense]|uniref:Mitochondrial glycoprotein n=1 Tax=Erythroxylum novogranatense TaxID=1862640 RepID=A0AAV8TS89_9ROSI|nr:hypothetical protein K2173_023729 [Erythroxylum novogranatense]
MLVVCEACLVGWVRVLCWRLACGVVCAACVCEERLGVGCVALEGAEGLCVTSLVWTNIRGANNVPDGFPSEIEDIPRERTILLKRKYLDETIKVEVDMPNVEVEEGNEDDDNTESNAPTYSKFLEIGVTAFPDEISIDSLTIKDSSISEDQLAYEGHDFNDLDENLLKAFHKYLEIRGIKPSTTKFLLEYMTEKDNREYLKWLNNHEKVADGN